MAFDTNFRGQLTDRRPQLWNSMDPENINWQKAGYWKIAEVMESYQQKVKERCALIKDMHMDWSSSARVLSDSMEKIPNNELISSIAYIILCDTDGQRVQSTTWIPRSPQTFSFLSVRYLGCHICLFAISREYQSGGIHLDNFKSMYIK
ncbi:uncharacterized protein [Miscanthus floridulus]|uniref:uncharacterized protein isoform X2 n=1 Tax=Miscanthus floridulus TaxID=154761 RepID=UPI00345A4F72